MSCYVLGQVEAYLRKNSLCVSGYAWTHTRIIIRVMLVLHICEMAKHD